MRVCHSMAVENIQGPNNVKNITFVCASSVKLEINFVSLNLFSYFVSVNNIKKNQGKLSG